MSALSAGFWNGAVSLWFWLDRWFIPKQGGVLKLEMLGQS